MLRILKTITLCLALSLLCASPSWAQGKLIDPHNILEPTLHQELQARIAAASEIDLFLAFPGPEDLATSFNNQSLADLTESILYKESSSRAAFVLSFDFNAPGKLGTAPAIRYAANDKFLLSKQQVTELLDTYYYTQATWNDSILTTLDALNKLYQEESRLHTMAWYIFIAIVLVILLVIMVSGGGSSSGGGGSYYYDSGSSWGDSGGGFSGGD